MTAEIKNKLENKTGISREWKTIQQMGGGRLVHARGCDYIRNWNMEGCQEINFRPGKQKCCKYCEKLAYISLGARDYAKKWQTYKKVFNRIPLYTIQLLFAKKHAKTIVNNGKIYIKCGKDNWYIDLSLDEVHLFHNNYEVNKRQKSEDWSMIGYHEHELASEENIGKLNEALLQIARYKFEKAVDVHSERRKERRKNAVTFADYDDYESDPYEDLSYYGF